MIMSEVYTLMKNRTPRANQAQSERYPDPSQRGTHVNIAFTASRYNRRCRSHTATVLCINQQERKGDKRRRVYYFCGATRPDFWYRLHTSGSFATEAAQDDWVEDEAGLSCRGFMLCRRASIWRWECARHNWPTGVYCGRKANTRGCGRPENQG